MKQSAGPDVPSIEVDRISKEFATKRGSVIALDTVTFTVKEGEFVSIVGPSGCGKSTLLRIIGGLRQPSSGRVIMRATQGATQPGIGFVFQTPSLLPWRTAIDNVLLIPRLRGVNPAPYRQRARELLALVSLSEFADRLPEELSGGMQQRVALCRALLHDPSVLLMDEPFGALDAITRDDMNAELLRIWQSSFPRKTILFVTHSIAEAVFLSDTVIVMSSRPGRIEGIISIDLPRPRVSESRGTERFGELVVNIFNLLHRD